MKSNKSSPMKENKTTISKTVNSNVNINSKNNKHYKEKENIEMIVESRKIENNSLIDENPSKKINKDNKLRDSDYFVSQSIRNNQMKQNEILKK